MVIVCDLDGVYVAYNEPFAKLLRQFGAELRPLPPAGPDRWDWYEAYGASSEQSAAALDYTERVPEWWGRLPLHPDMDRAAQDALVALCWSSAAVYFVTSRPPNTLDQTRWWLEHRLKVPKPAVVVTPRRKALALAALEPTLIIEDRLATLRAYAGLEGELGLPPCEKILVSRPYNGGDHTGLTVVESTGEALLAALGRVER